MVSPHLKLLINFTMAHSLAIDAEWMSISLVSTQRGSIMSSVPEKDWKLFRKLQNDLTAKTCELIFVKVEELAKKREGIEHKSYLDLFDLIQAEDAKIAEMFNNPTRNNILLKLVSLKNYDILTEEQFQMFSQQTQDRIASILELRC